MNKDLHIALKSLNLKITPKRLAILDILAAASVYLGPEEVWKRMKKRFKKIGLPTIYRNLEDLANGGIIIKIIHPDRRLYYYLCRKAGHHHHFICVSCKKVEDISFCGADEIEEEVKKNLKGHVISHLLQVYGLCGKCSASKTISS
jgi:Fe2+ or Zn2+ uptake regulation protein